jgi:hypothetical protein
MVILAVIYGGKEFHVFGPTERIVNFLQKLQNYRKHGVDLIKFTDESQV